MPARYIIRQNIARYNWGSDACMMHRNMAGGYGPCRRVGGPSPALKDPPLGYLWPMVRSDAHAVHQLCNG